MRKYKQKRGGTKKMFTADTSMRFKTHQTVGKMAKSY